MLYSLHSLADEFPGFEVFAPAEFRALLAALCAFLLAIIAGPVTIRLLTRRQMLDRVRKGDSKELDRMSAHKEATPTLGGVILFGAVLISTCLWARLDERLVLLCLGFVVGLGLLGLFDDLTKMRRRRKGMPARTKLAWQLALSSAVAVYLYAVPLEVHSQEAVSAADPGLGLFLPYFSSGFLPLGLLFIPLVVVVTTGASNAVNLADGLDGLATGCSVLVAGAFTVVAFFAGCESASSFLHIPHVDGIREVAVFLAALVGGGLGFLWFNCHPAQIFMGDTGALPLGGSLGLVAVLCKQEVLLALVGGVLVAEAASVIVQVGAYKIWRRRVFLIAPLHHHFQFKGLSEPQITVRFWIAGALLAVFSLATLRMN